MHNAELRGSGSPGKLADRHCRETGSAPVPCRRRTESPPLASVGDGLDRPETYDIRKRKTEKAESSKPFSTASKAKRRENRKAVRDDVGIVPYGVRRVG